MSSAICPHCGQRTPSAILGNVRVTELQKRIFEMVRAATNSTSNGIESDVLFTRTGVKSRASLRVTIGRLNEILEDEGWHIRGSKSLRRYCLVRLSP